MTIKIFKKLYSYFRPYRWLFCTGFVFMLIQNSLMYVVPWGVGHIWDYVFPVLGKRPDGVWLLVKWCSFLLLAGLMRAFFLFPMIYLFWYTGTKVVRDLRNQLYQKLQVLSFRYYNKVRIGDLMSRLTLDIELIKNFYAYNIEHRSQIYMYDAIIASLLFIIDWKLALLCLAIAPVIIPTTLLFSNKMRQAVIERQVQAGILNAKVQENITGIRVVKAFAMEDSEFKNFNTENKIMLNKNLHVTKLQAFLQPFLIFGVSIGMAAILWYGGFRVIHGQMSLGKLISFVFYLTMLNWPFTMLAPNTNQIRQVEGAVKRVTEILNEPEEITSPKDGGKLLPALNGKIEFDGVSFGYHDKGTPAGYPIIKDLNLTVMPGEKVAIIGLTGSGKSTLVSLIPRFYDPQLGAIRVDGVDLRELNLNWWRQRIGLVLQETFLFSATIADNIAFGRPDSSLAEIRKAAQAAQIDDHIMQLPEGYNTIVGERGVGLSGGQKQRVAIARAILLNPKILILDDSTSSVDVETEREIQTALGELMFSRTTILITQRLSTAKLADRVIILESGEIRAQGTHEDLMDQNQLYQELYNIQTMQDLPQESA
ncbi:MAG TPA: ABC transporter ATP-binding protein [Firmicutes bacterium]|jgi:ABC-type multidrug transport system fused ATPase/permease subunit|nr:ABC transporter ATP-binding protein [Bacillota bacterium]